MQAAGLDGPGGKAGNAPQVSQVPKPWADDWRQCIAPFADSPLVRPRRGMDYPKAVGVEEARAAGRLSSICPRGLYFMHLVSSRDGDCDCAAAEAAGTFDSSCAIHALCAYASGAWVAPGPGPPVSQQAGQRPAASGSLGPAERAYVDQTLPELIALGGPQAVSG